MMANHSSPLSAQKKETLLWKSLPFVKNQTVELPPLIPMYHQQQKQPPIIMQSGNPTVHQYHVMFPSIQNLIQGPPLPLSFPPSPPQQFPFFPQTSLESLPTHPSLPLREVRVKEEKEERERLPLHLPLAEAKREEGEKEKEKEKEKERKRKREQESDKEPRRRKPAEDDHEGEVESEGSSSNVRSLSPTSIPEPQITNNLELMNILETSQDVTQAIFPKAEQIYETKIVLHNGYLVGIVNLEQKLRKAEIRDGSKRPSTQHNDRLRAKGFAERRLAKKEKDGKTFFLKKANDSDRASIAAVSQL